MSHRLQTAWSVCCGVATISLIALWVRSYWRYEIVTIRSFPHSIVLGATKGVAYINYGRASPDSSDPADEGWHYEPQTPTDLHEPLVFSYGDHLLIITPIWLPLIIAAIPTIAPGAVYAARKMHPRSAHPKRR